MNRRYIDFVPANNSTRVKTPAKAMVRKTTVVQTIEETPIRVPESRIEPSANTQLKTLVGQPRPSLQPRPAMVARARKMNPAMTQGVRRATAVNPSASMARRASSANSPTLGVVEDLNTHFVNKNVSKRPLSDKSSRSAQRSSQKSQHPVQPSVADLKAKKVKAGLATKSVATKAKKPVSKMELSKEASTYKAPKPAFINQNKVVKRPLSGNVYHKQPAKAVKEEPKGPVTIIAKPEKDKHIGIVITIIITIILGAAAGTVAFLLLPK